MSGLTAFIAECQQQQPGLAVDSQHFFEGVIALPLEQERLLQAYIAYNLQLEYGSSGEIILFESTLPGNTSDEGRLDLVFRVDDSKILLIETKYLGTDAGRTARSRRTKHRGKVLAQVKAAKEDIIKKWSISPSDIRCGVFSNDEKVAIKARAQGLEGCYISEETLVKWRKGEYERLFHSRVGQE